MFVFSTFVFLQFFLMEYNTTRSYLSMREYGRHIQGMVDYVLTIEDRTKRNEQAKAVIELMGFLNPHLRNVEDFRHMLWDHLFFISDFKLDVDSPYPIPQRETYKAKPDALPYPDGTTGSLVFDRVRLFVSRIGTLSDRL